MATIVVGGLLLTAAAGGIAAGAAGATAGAVVVRKKRKKKKLKALRKKLFGEEITALNPKYLSNDGIPVVIDITCRSLEENGYDNEGLFRIPGSASRIQILADAFRKGTEKALSKINLSLEDPHDVGGLFKLYFRSLPESLCTFDKFLKFVEVQEDYGNNLDEWLTQITKLLSSLPDINCFVFMRILPLFHLVVQHAETNLMTVENLSIVFAPTLFYSSDEDPLAMLTHSSQLCNLLTLMIIHQEEIIKRVHRASKLHRLPKKTVNASMLFKKQQLAEYYEEIEDECEDPAELEAIRELLTDEFEIKREEKQTDKMDITDENFFSTPLSNNSYQKPLPIPPSNNNKPLPVPPPNSNTQTLSNISLEKEPIKPSTIIPKKPLPLPPSSRISVNKPLPTPPNKPIPPTPPPRH